MEVRGKLQSFTGFKKIQQPLTVCGPHLDPDSNKIKEKIDEAIDWLFDDIKELVFTFLGVTMVKVNIT